MPLPITPLPAELLHARPRLLMVFGGSFDPPHTGHTLLPVAARANVPGGDDGVWLLYVPAARSPHKDAIPRATPDQRLAMLTLALASVPRSAVWRDELDRGAAGAGSPSYTVDTLTRLREQLDAAGLGTTTLRLLIGADQALGFHRWHKPREIIKLAEPTVMVRGVVAEARHLTGAMSRFGYWNDADLDAWRTRLIDAEPIDASSTGVRAALATGDEASAARMLDPLVREYIRQHNLYGGPASRPA